MKAMNDEKCRICGKPLSDENRHEEYGDLCRECGDSEQEEDDFAILF